MRLRIQATSKPLAGRYCPPGDKSISHRVAILGGLARGTSVIEGFLEAADTRATLAAMASLGAEVTESEGRIRITGGRLEAGNRTLDLGNSGTGMRLLAGMLSGRPELIGHTLTLIGDESLSARPMDRIIRPLSEMGARIGSREGRAPLSIEPQALHGIRYAMPVASAQVKSALLLAGLVADGATVVVEPGPSRDHTERLLPAFGVDLLDGAPGVGVRGGAELRATELRVPGDLSSASFVMAAALMVPGSRVEVDNVGLNPTRDGVLRIIDAMGGRVERLSDETVGLEPVGRLAVHGEGLRGLEIPPAWVPLAIDEFPIVMAMAAAAEGETVIRGARELRVKESDRLAVMCEALAAVGVDVTETPDGAVIRGGRVRGGRVDSHGDHRIAMSMAVLGLVSEGDIVVERAQWIETSYPGFVDDMVALGADMQWEADDD
ncbi:3-phosphoshikimate 1-carboxyvinyltransferase [Wenzhouxiangella marina]|uniref:3-phosphoshikimate 1-carboxyvinyltransferase n=1 Tax=Wenzhouxiangella marina TaxID=1579979 RepID=A0A0K0XVK1_9GAMM|nr:3-phosphoshikimate 1-carboxyvinyltransferase [Wenzhouxiangella marina]AKS41698.1 3-phosphoshikimate 1-carboxyvinyltransferase [Wenzhouxiangella marina]MBB6086540.1 3-phosphoshikimate 1-carboxyvinyltransferase [Wenzhouxiangella marina]